MISSKNQEEISKCYFCAIASMIDAVINSHNRDEDGIDICVSKEMKLSENGKPFVADVNFQLKSVYSRTHYGFTENKDLYYDLKVKNYNDLVKKAMTPRLLGLLVLPENLDDWVKIEPDKMILKKCMYFVSLKDFPTSNNKTTVRITIPKGNLLTFDSLTKILQKAADGSDI